LSLADAIEGHLAHLKAGPGRTAERDFPARACRNRSGALPGGRCRALRSLRRREPTWAFEGFGVKVSSAGSGVDLARGRCPLFGRSPCGAATPAGLWMAARGGCFEGCFAAQSAWPDVLDAASPRTVRNRTTRDHAVPGAAGRNHHAWRTVFGRGCRWGSETVRVRGTLTRCFLHRHTPLRTAPITFTGLADTTPTWPRLVCRDDDDRRKLHLLTAFDVFGDAARSATTRFRHSGRAPGPRPVGRPDVHTRRSPDLASPPLAAAAHRASCWPFGRCWDSGGPGNLRMDWTCW